MWGQYKLGLKGLPPPKSNISKAEAQAIRELKGDKDRLGLTADKE